MTETSKIIDGPDCISDLSPVLETLPKHPALLSVAVRWLWKLYSELEILNISERIMKKNKGNKEEMFWNEPKSRFMGSDPQKRKL